MPSRTTILALLAGLLPLNCAASSFVYEDIIAQPRYRVVLTENKIPESSVYTDIEQGEVDINSDNSKDDALSTHFTTYTQSTKANQVIMMSAYGQPFQCTIPIVEEQDDESKSASHKNNNNDIVNEQEDTQKIIDRGLKLLEPLSSKGCIYYQKPDYWTYEYCHKKHVRQFHVDRSAIQTDPPTRTPQGPSFYLGVFSPTSITSNNGEGEGSSSTTTTSSEKTDIAEPSTSLKHVGNQRYLTQRWTDGSECDLTGKPRSIEVQFHCDMNSGDQISMLQEVTTCQYQMSISTPRLCEEMMLASQTQSDANKIQCNPIVPDHMLKSTSAQQLGEQQQQPVAEEPAEPEMQPEVQGESAFEKTDDEKEQTKLQQNVKQQPMQAKQDGKDHLLELISGLTAQINDLQQQVGGRGASSSLSLESLLKGRLQKEGSDSDNNNNGDKKEEIEIAYFHVDENGVLVPEEGVDMKKLMESYMKMLTSVKDNQNQKPMKKTESEEDREQQRNRKAYEMTYFQ
ncbi:hypothetical protein BDA99DRAFT_554118 [Phascolomyces articulosus]|uniref:Protein OS-9 homolog n=1 Tax=Phascolomyces articulosus TaxID=60185 RepID=A0AAD5KC37_9FUNG|nr:hypothetical protein BDA99DRAFT_554118 [Phascolomyces articulosus]